MEVEIIRDGYVHLKEGKKHIGDVCIIQDTRFDSQFHKKVQSKKAKK